MPRPVERIDRILALLETHWKGRSDIRLGQLIYNLAYPNDVFNIEDSELERRLESSNDEPLS